MGRYGLVAKVVKNLDGDMRLRAARGLTLDMPEVNVVAQAVRGCFANVALFGDSNAGAMFNIGGTTVETQAHGFGSYIEPYSMGRAVVVWNAATGGQEVIPDAGQTNPLSVQIDSFLASPISSTVTDVGVMMGTNDADAAPSTVMAALVQQLKRLARYRVHLSSLYPAGGTTNAQSTFEAGTTRWQWVLRYNTLIRQFARDNAGWIRLVDAYSIGVDPTSATGLAATNMLYDSALHSSNVYAQRVGKAFSDSICLGMPSVYPWLTSAADLSSLASTATEKPTNFLPNGLFTASGATAQVGNVQAGTTATGWSVTANGGATVTPSIVANPNGFGSCQQLSLSMTAQNDYVRMSSTADFKSQVSPGDEVFSRMWIRIPNGSGICAPRLIQTITMDGVTYTRTAFANIMANALANLDACDLLLTTPSVVLPGGVSITTVSQQLTLFAVGAGAANSNVLVGQAEMRKVQRYA